jgi:hypothetical protein
MTVYLIRYNATKGRRWLAFNEDASVKVKTAKSKAFALDTLAERLGKKITKVVRYSGIMRASEAAFTVADHVR